MEHRALTAIFTATAVAVVVIVLLFVWPGFSPTSCSSPSGTTQSINGREYCFVTVSIPVALANYTEWNYRFHLHSSFYPGGPVLNVTVTEPNGTTFAGDLGWVGPTFQNSTSTWISSDASGGAIAFWHTHNVSLLVAR